MEKKRTGGKISEEETMWLFRWGKIAGDFFKNLMLKSPIELLFQLAILIAGAYRTIDLFTKMGQGGVAAIIGVIYAELGIIFYEILHYKGRRVKKKFPKPWWMFWRTEKELYQYPLWNQKTIAWIGLWLVHIPLTVIFTTSDLVLANLQAMTGDLNFGETFAWILGIVIGLGFFADLALIINFRLKDPQSEHDEKLNQLLWEREQYEMDRQLLSQEKELEYHKENASELERIRAQLKARATILKEFKDVVTPEQLDGMLQKVEIQKSIPSPHPHDESEKEVNKEPENF